jgi:hypothetical protein
MPPAAAQAARAVGSRALHVPFEPNGDAPPQSGDPPTRPGRPSSPTSALLRHVRNEETALGRDVPATEWRRFVTVVIASGARMLLREKGLALANGSGAPMTSSNGGSTPSNIRFQ